MSSRKPADSHRKQQRKTNKRTGGACAPLSDILPSARVARFSHGGRSAVYAARRHPDPRASWLNRLREATGHNVAAVALANKNARVAWALLRYGEDYRPARAHRQAPPRRAHRSASEKMLAGAVQSAHPITQSREHFFVPPSVLTKGGTKKSLKQGT
jgi:hypothetical protein